MCKVNWNLVLKKNWQQAGLLKPQCSLTVRPSDGMPRPQSYFCKVGCWNEGWRVGFECRQFWMVLGHEVLGSDKVHLFFKSMSRKDEIVKCILPRKCHHMVIYDVIEQDDMRAIPSVNQINQFQVFEELWVSCDARSHAYPLSHVSNIAHAPIGLCHALLCPRLRSSIPVEISLSSSRPDCYIYTNHHIDCTLWSIVSGEPLLQLRIFDTTLCCWWHWHQGISHLAPLIVLNYSGHNRCLLFNWSAWCCTFKYGTTCPNIILSCLGSVDLTGVVLGCGAWKYPVH